MDSEESSDNERIVTTVSTKKRPHRHHHKTETKTLTKEIDPDFD